MDSFETLVTPSLRRSVTYDPEPFVPHGTSSSHPKLPLPERTKSPELSLPPPINYDFYVSGTTDPGGVGKTNQDDFFIWKRDEKNFCVGIFDGHGREMGSIASQIATQTMKEYLSNEGALEAVAADPENEMTHLFDIAHQAIESSFRQYYETQGWIIEKSTDGYLVKRRKDGSPDICVHGGTTATLLVVVEGHKMIVGNVGDSSAILGGQKHPPLKHSRCWSNSSMDVDTEMSSTSSTDDGIEKEPQHLTIDHSPDDIREFNRIAQFRPNTRRKGFPEVLFVYDALSASKHSCPDIYVSKLDNSISVTNKGKYYKNVRCEWASLITTPPYAKFQDALAFTRSIGDFHLHSYGVSHVPSVQCFDLADLSQDSTSVIIVGSDGIWDNWKYKDAIDFCMEEERMKSIQASKDSTLVTKQFMDQNIVFAKKNFGNQADNMTAILIYVVNNKKI